MLNYFFVTDTDLVLLSADVTVIVYDEPLLPGNITGWLFPLVLYCDNAGLRLGPETLTK